jgi:flavin reductase (DIM6/NTAB) family NADH-FMN oxidoreductase RutF
MTDGPESNRPSPRPIDIKTFWRTLGERAIGATVVTAQGADGPAGFLGLSATHVCADPPTMLVSIDGKTSALAAVLHARHFAINYLGRDARDVADMFAGKTSAKGAARFEPGRWGTLVTGAPVFTDAIGALDCVLEKTIDHFATTIAVGRVVDVRARGSGDPLIYFRGSFLS